MEADNAWIGLDMETHPGGLRSGFYSKGENVRCDNGRLRSRGGHQMTTFTNTSVNSHNPVALGTVYGVCTFADPDGTQTGAVIACASNAWLIYPGQAPSRIEYPSGTTLSTACTLFQDFNKVYLFSGSTPLVWDPDFAQVFSVVVADGASSYDFPDADFGGSFENRLFANDGKDTLYISNIIAPTVFSVNGQFFINDGSDDRLMNAIAFSQRRLVVFKNQSVHVIDGSDPDVANFSVSLMTKDSGLIARDAAVSVGSEVYFLSEDGVRTLTQIDDTRFEATAEPVSKPVKPIIDNINFASVSAAQMTYMDNRLFIAIPTGEQTLNQTVLVYNFTNQSWESVDSSGFDVFRFLKLDFGGRKRLFAVTQDGRIFHYDYDWDCADYEDTTTTNTVTSTIETRGYTGDTMENKRRIRASAVVASWSPTLTLGTISDGVNEVYTSLSGHTKSRTLYETDGTAAWDPTNTNNDFANPYRQDYSIAPGNTSGILLQSGLLPHLMQEFTYSVSSRGLGRSIQMRIANTTGRIEVRGSGLTNTIVNRRRITV